MSNSKGFVRSKQALRDHDVKVSKSVKRFDYLKKNQKQRFWFAAVPAVEGYSPRPIAYHRHVAQLNIKDGVYDVSTQCIGSNCPACTAAFRQYKETPYSERGSEWYKVDKKKALSHFFIVYEVLLNEDGSAMINELAAPEILEYRYNKNGDCLDWENFMDAYDEATAKGLDPQDPNGAVVFEVTQEKEKVIGGDMMRTAYKHRALDTTVAIPENYLGDLTSRVKLSDLYIKLDREDMDLVVSADVKSKRAMASQDEDLKRQELIEVGSKCKEVKSPDFQRILEYFENRDDDAGDQSKGSIAEQVRKNTYSQHASKNMAESSVSTAPTGGETSSEGGNSPLSEQDKDKKIQSARERIIAIKNKRKQNQDQ